MLAKGRVVLKPRKSKPFFGRHPWVLDSGVARVEGQPADGDVVDLHSHQGNFIARGVINSRSRIRVRLYTWNENEPLDEDFWRRKIEAAVRLRTSLGYTEPEGAVRLVFSEGDGLSGLVADRYAGYLVLQATALAVAVRLPMIAEILGQLIRPVGIVLRTEKGIAQAEGIELRDGPLCGDALPSDLQIAEHGLRYHVDLAEGQKTGFYLDQRDNRHAAAKYLAGRSVLDMFCYSGGFGFHAVRAGAREVLGIDTSEKAVTLAWANAELNGIENIRFQRGNCFPTLEALQAEGRRFGAVILDPPKFARSRRSIDEALRAYHYLNRLGVELLEPGGILVTCSCSGHVGREDFLDMLLGVAQQTGQSLQVLEVRGAAPDHPVMITCPESEYLKCVICRAG